MTTKRGLIVASGLTAFALLGGVTVPLSPLLTAVNAATPATPATPTDDADDPAALMRQGAMLEAAGKWQQAAVIYDKAAKAYEAKKQFSEQAGALEKSATMYEKYAKSLAGGGSGGRGAPAPAVQTAVRPETPVAERVAVAPRPNAPVRLAPLQRRPGWIIGRAVFEDGRPVPNFTVNVAVGFKVAIAQGHNGQYAFHVTDPAAIIVSGFTAKATLPFNGQNYVLEMQPTDGLSNDEFYHQKNTNAINVQKGIVRDFVFRRTGTKPGYKPTTPDAALREGSFSVSSSFLGAYIQLETTRDLPVPANSTLQVTLTPTGPLVDGSAGQTIRRLIPKTEAYQSYYVYDIPLGTYTASVGLVSPDGSAHPCHLKMKVYGTNVESGPTPQNTVAISWPFDEKLSLYGYPMVTVSP